MGCWNRWYGESAAEQGEPAPSMDSVAMQQEVQDMWGIELTLEGEEGDVPRGRGRVVERGRKRPLSDEHGSGDSPQEDSFDTDPFYTDSEEGQGVDGEDKERVARQGHPAEKRRKPGDGLNERMAPLAADFRRCTGTDDVARGDQVSFCCGGKASALSNPGLFIPAYGYIELPATTRSCGDRLLESFERAPYGKAEDTVYDDSYRKTFQLSPQRFSLRNPDFDRHLRELVDTEVCLKLGFPTRGSAVSVQLYKLLLYHKGCLFKPHRDTQKFDGMFATLVVQLPSVYTGGAAVMSHMGQKVRFESGSVHADEMSPYTEPDSYEPCCACKKGSAEDDPQHTRRGRCVYPNLARSAPTTQQRDVTDVRNDAKTRVLACDGVAFAATYYCFYCDVEHELEEVTGGSRLALVYSLCWTGTPAHVPRAIGSNSAAARMLQALKDARLDQFVWFFDHMYSRNELQQLGADVLKGGDRLLMSCLEHSNKGLVTETGEDAPYTFVFAQVQYTLEFSDCEVYEQSLRVGDCINVADKSPCPRLFFKPDLRITEPDNDLLNYRLETCHSFSAVWGKEGSYVTEATGNEGASAEYWYHKVALMVFRRTLGFCLKHGITPPERLDIDGDREVRQRNMEVVLR